jgi:hypothetical protein
MSNGFAILVICKNGDEEYLKQGLSFTPARFSSRRASVEQKQFMLQGMDEDVQSVNVVPFPRGHRLEKVMA